MIDEAEVRFYRDNGYLFVPSVFSDIEVASMRAAAYRNVELSKTVSGSDERFDVGPGHSKHQPRLRRLKNPCDHEEVFASASRSEALLDIVSALVGPDVRFDHSKLNFKPRGAAETIEWHQDWAFYPHTNDDILAVGVLLEDATHDNGPLMVVPESHKGPVYDHHRNGYFVGAIDLTTADFDAKSSVEITGKAGGVTIHHVRTIHGSRDNRSDQDRPLLLLSYAAVDAWPLIGDLDIEEFDARILRGAATHAPRQVALPIRVPLPRINTKSDSIYDDQDSVRGASFGEVGQST